MWLWYTDVPRSPIGIFDHEDDVAGVSSIRLPDGSITRTLRDIYDFAERLDDLVPGLGDAWRFLTP